MKTLLLALTLICASASAFSQSDNATILEQRAKDFHTAITKNDKDGWRKFMNENFTKALIERPMRAQVSTSENDGAATTTNSETRVEEKLTMFERLHEDFGKSKISSITVTANKVVMKLQTTSGMQGIFSLEAEPKSPWQIDKMGIEVEAQN